MQHSQSKKSKACKRLACVADNNLVPLHSQLFLALPNIVNIVDQYSTMSHETAETSVHKLTVTALLGKLDP